MFLARKDKPCFLVCLAVSQLTFILLLYRRGASSVFQGIFGAYPGWDYSKTQDVYTNLSLFVPDSEAVKTQYCPVKSPILVGPLTISVTKPPSLKKIQLKNRYVQSGGYFSPRHCFGRYRTAVIIPHRNRESHLRTLLYYLHPFLQRQQLHYTIFVVHQAGNATFNRAKLLNVGVREALRYDDWDCLISHDVDLVPENDYNLYVCDDLYPKHLSSAMDKFQYRIRLSGMSMTRTPLNLGRYKMIPHDRDSGNEENSHRHNLLRNTRLNWRDDGMNSLDFHLISREKTLLYTNITVDIGDAPVMPTKARRWQFF
ncbi:beta-1,4-galactosyltransferase 3-like isoform X2 [Rhinoderma darwinii]|uniref:beta-1,4-galactosyltransferase 3-like isoform X2 n=1 Tax=Rhinoderma darwinii TaxID=43563 RepID=UPI003F674731